MAKKVVTIDIEKKDLEASSKPSEAKVAKSAKVEEKKEVENFGIVEINNASATKKIKNKTEKGFEKNVSGSEKKSVKSHTSKVEDYFDFSFRTQEKAKAIDSKKAETKVENAKVEAKAETPVVSLKLTDDVKKSQAENVSNSVKFDSEATQIVRVARMGSLFDCDKRMMNA